MSDVYKELNIAARCLQELDVEGVERIIKRFRKEPKLLADFKIKAFLPLNEEPLKSCLTSELFVPKLKPHMLYPLTFIDFLIIIGTDVLTLSPLDVYEVEKRDRTGPVRCSPAQATVGIFTILSLIVPVLVESQHRVMGWTGGLADRTTQEAILGSFKTIQEEQKEEKRRRTVTPDARMRVGSGAGAGSSASSAASSPALPPRKCGCPSSVEVSPERRTPPPVPALFVPSGGAFSSARKLDFTSGTPGAFSLTSSALPSAVLPAFSSARVSSGSASSRSALPFAGWLSGSRSVHTPVRSDPSREHLLTEAERALDQPLIDFSGPYAGRG